MKKIFFISGLGANKLAFSKIEDLPYEKVCVPWIKMHPDDTITSYSSRMIKANNITQEDILVGLSFGGLIAQEMCKQLNKDEVILISSFQKKEHLRPLFRKSLDLNLNALIPSFKVPLVDNIVGIFLNSGTKESKAVLSKMIEETDHELLKLSIKMIQQVKPDQYNIPRTYNIIGDSDRILQLWRE